MKILCLGDSLTEGYGHCPQENWPNFLSQLLEDDIINEGVSGDTTTGMLNRFICHGLSKCPHYVIVMGGTNDVICGVPYEVILSNIIAIVRNAKKNGILPIIGLPPKTYSSETNESKVFITGVELNKKIDTLRERIKTLAIEDEQYYIDFDSGLTELSFEEDGIHPTLEARRVMAEQVKLKMEHIINGT